MLFPKTIVNHTVLIPKTDHYTSSCNYYLLRVSLSLSLSRDATWLSINNSVLRTGTSDITERAAARDEQLSHFSNCQVTRTRARSAAANDKFDPSDSLLHRGAERCAEATLRQQLPRIVVLRRRQRQRRWVSTALRCQRRNKLPGIAKMFKCLRSSTSASWRAAVSQWPSSNKNILGIPHKVISERDFFAGKLLRE